MNLVNPAVIGTAEDVFNHFLVNPIVKSLHQDPDPDTRDGQNHDGVEECKDGKDSNSDKPEPKEDVDLLIDDIKS